MIRHDYSQPYITRDEYLEVKGIDLNIELQDDDNTSNKVNRFIQDITNFVLDHLVMEYNCNELNRQNYAFEDLAEFRRVRFHYGMLDQIEYVLNNGLIQLDSGINRETGAITDFSGIVIGSAALKQFRLGGFCNKQEGYGHRGDLSPRDMPTIEELLLALSNKVDKVDGKGLSANDFTTAYKMLLDSLSREIENKVDKILGKGLSTNDFTDAYKVKLENVDFFAQVNKIEEIRINNEPLTITGKAVNIDAAPLIEGKEDKSNKVAQITSESTDAQYPTARCVYNELQSVREAAEGKTKSFSVNPATSGNEEFQNGDATITVTSFVDVNGNTIIVNQLKKGDLVFTLNGENVKYADRWLVDPATGTWGLIDADTPDLSGYVTTGTEQTVTGNKRLFNAFLSFLNSQASGNAEYVLEENQYGQLAISRIYNNLKATLWLLDGRTLLPSSDNQNDLGGSNRRLKDGYFAGQVYAQNTDNVLTAPSSTTLTDSEYATLTNGKWTRIVGNLGQYANPVITNLQETSTAFFGFLCSGRYLTTIYINKSTKVYVLDGNYNGLVGIDNINGKNIKYYQNNVYPYATNSTTTLQYETINEISVSANTTFTLAIAPANTYPEYKANITNSSASAITLTFTGVAHILCNDDNCVVSNGTNSTITLPAGVSIEISILNGEMLAVNFSAN